MASLIRHHYEKILYPFDLFVQGVLASSATNTASDDLNSTNDLALHPPADKRVKLNADGTKTESERPVRVSPRRSGRRLNGCQENNLNSPNKEQTTVPLPIVATKLYSESSEIPVSKDEN